MTYSGKVLPVRSSQFYDALAPAYPGISETRLPYLDGIDELVVAKARPMQPTSYMDVGCGDGRRTLKIASSLGIKRPVGVDESINMLAQAVGMRTEHISITDLDIHEEFDVVTALWNVLGHVQGRERSAALIAISKHLRHGGLFMLDVNNRYNVRAYGQEVVDGNRKADEIGENCGDVTAHHNANGITYATVGHVFHPDEIDQIVDNIPTLEIKDKLSVDYSTGETVSSFDEGQIFYEIVKL